MREAGEEVCGRNERSDPSRARAQAEQTHGRRIRGTQESAPPCQASNGEEASHVALRAV